MLIVLLIVAVLWIGLRISVTKQMQGCVKEDNEPKQ